MIGPLLKPAEVARLLNVAPSTVHRLMDRGELPYVRISLRCIRISQAAIDGYLQRQAHQPEVAEAAQHVACLPERSRRGRAGALSGLSSAGAAFIAEARAAREKRMARR